MPDFRKAGLTRLAIWNRRLDYAHFAEIIDGSRSSDWVSLHLGDHIAGGYLGPHTPVETKGVKFKLEWYVKVRDEPDLIVLYCDRSGESVVFYAPPQEECIPALMQVPPKNLSTQQGQRNRVA